MTTFYLDPEGGSDAGAGTAFATRWKTINTGATAARIAPGDVIRVMAARDRTDLGDGTWTDNSSTVTLAGAKTANIWKGDEAWTAVSANVTGSTSNTQRKIGTTCQTAAVASGFTTGKVGYKTLAAPVDASGYQQVCFWLFTTVALAAGVLELKLCTDATGDVAVHTISVPATQASTWIPVVWDNAGALNAAIASVALYAASDPGTPTVRVQNVFVAKDKAASDCLTLHSLIGRADSSGFEYHPIQSIDTTAVVLGTGVVSGLGGSDVATKVWRGSTGTVTTYALQAIDLNRNGWTQALGTTVDAGSAGSPITLSGGWDRTAMSSQSGETVWHGGSIADIVTLSHTHWALEKMSFAGATAAALRIAAAPTSMSYASWTNSLGAWGCGYGFSPAYQPGLASVAQPPLFVLDIDQLIGHVANSSDGAGIYDQAHTCRIQAEVRRIDRNHWGYRLRYVPYLDRSLSSETFSANAFGVQVNNSGTGGGGRLLVNGATFSNNSSADVDVTEGTPTRIVLIDCDTQSTTKINLGGTYESRVSSQRYAKTDADHRIHGRGFTIQTDASVRHTASDFSWKVSPTHATHSVDNPVTLPLATVVCAGGAAVTFKTWLRRTNTGLTLGLRIAGWYPGITAPVSAAMTAAADTWEEITLSFTPSEDCAVEVEGYAYGGTTYSGYFDDVSVTQA